MQIAARLHLAVLATAAIFAVAPARAGDCNTSFTEVFERASPSVVTILAITVDPFRTADRVALHEGTGFAVAGADLLNPVFVTNAHVVYGAKLLKIQTKTGEQSAAQVVGADPVFDLAVVRPLVPFARMTPLELADSDLLSVAEPVMAVGSPLGLSQTATVGVVSALQRVLPLSTLSYLRPLIQTDAAINPGNSGGPLLNACGDAVGVNTLAMRDAQGLNFAIPSNLVKKTVPELVASGHISRPRYGV